MISIDNQPFMQEYASLEFLEGIPFICLPPRIHETRVSWYQGINQPWESAMINTKFSIGKIYVRVFLVF